MNVLLQITHTGRDNEYQSMLKSISFIHWFFKFPKIITTGLPFDAVFYTQISKCSTYPGTCPHSCMVSEPCRGFPRKILAQCKQSTNCVLLSEFQLLCCSVPIISEAYNSLLQGSRMDKKNAKCNSSGLWKTCKVQKCCLL